MRGLKHICFCGVAYRNVAPHTGAWIETLVRLLAISDRIVAPHTGAWIETIYRRYFGGRHYVAPHTGAWIETLKYLELLLKLQSRTPHGCVD